MAKVKLITKEFKTALKALLSLCTQRHNLSVTLAVANDNLRMILFNNNVYAEANLKVTILEAAESYYTFMPEILNQMNLNSPDIILSWTSPDSSLGVKCGTLNTSLKLSISMPEFGVIPESFDVIEIPHVVIYNINKQLDIPFAYYKSKDPGYPVRIYTRNGLLEAAADDGYSLAKVETQITCDKDLDILLPKFVLDTIVGVDKPSFHDNFIIGRFGMTYMLKYKDISSIFPGLALEVSNFEDTISRIDAWATSCYFNSSYLGMAIKSITSMIPSTDMNGVLLKVKMHKDGMSMNLRHNKIGEGAIESVAGVKEIYNENSVNNYYINMHPQAFIDYTNLIKSNEARMMANANVVYYEGDQILEYQPKKNETGQPIKHLIRSRYLFPTVQT